MAAKPQEHAQKSVVQAEASRIIAAAHQRLESHPQFHRHCQTIRIDLKDNHLVLTGCLPSFYLKQLAQEALRGLAGPIDNQIDVLRSNGLSSTRLDAKDDRAP